MKIKSSYSAAITGGSFLFEETEALLPMLMSPNAESLLVDEKVHNNCLHINAETSRKKAIIEIRRRYNAVPISFWHEYLNMSKEDKIVALFYVLLEKAARHCITERVSSDTSTVSIRLPSILADNMRESFLA